MVSLAAPCIGLPGKVPQWGCVSVFVALSTAKAGSFGGRKEGNWSAAAKKRPKVVESGKSGNEWRHWRQNSLISLRRFPRRSPHRAPGRRARPPAPHAPLPHAPAHCGRWYRRFACAVHAPGQADPPNVCGATSCQHRKGRGMGGERSVGAAALVFVGPLSRCP